MGGAGGEVSAVVPGRIPSATEVAAANRQSRPPENATDVAAEALKAQTNNTALDVAETAKSAQLASLGIGGGINLIG